MGAHEIRLRIGRISRQRVYQLARRPDFPAPVADLAQGKVWLADDVEAWIATRRRRPAGASGSSAE
jgi:predicted DNA-binding transcriptional regulator AlpA